jgi:Fur family ferric uptake transcriptional regulator
VERAASERDTRQKRAIRNVFTTENRPLSTEQVHTAARVDIEGLGLATVYRSIRTLIDDGWLTVIDVPGQGTLYEIAGKAHHHHFSCDACRRVFEVEGCAKDISVVLPRGFRASSHEITVRGRCADCASLERTRRRSHGTIA